jgi:hypothetical protein
MVRKRSRLQVLQRPCSALSGSLIVPVFVGIGQRASNPKRDAPEQPVQENMSRILTARLTSASMMKVLI